MIVFVPENFTVGLILITGNSLSFRPAQVTIALRMSHFFTNMLLLFGKTMRFFLRQFSPPHTVHNTPVLIIRTFADLCLYGSDAKTKDNGRGE
jgi:hypothetical protein